MADDLVKLPLMVSGSSVSQLAKAPIPVSDNHRMINRILADLIFLIKLKCMYQNPFIISPKETLRNLNKYSNFKEYRMKKEKLCFQEKVHNKNIYQRVAKNKSMLLLRTKTQSSVILEKSTSLTARKKPNTSRSLNEFQKNNSLRFGRQEKIALYLSPQLQKFSENHKLRQKKAQIRYVNTLKKVKKTGENLGCVVRAKTQGIQLQLSKDLEQEASAELRYTLRKQFDRLLRKKIVKESKFCCEEASNLNSTLQKDKKQMNDCLKINQKERNYKCFDVSRFQSYLKGKSTNQPKYNFYIKKQIQQKLNKANHQQRLQDKKSENADSLWDTRRTTFYSSSSPNSPISRKFSYNEDIENMSSSPKLMSRIDEFKEDLIQFFEICEFYKKIQHELLRYLPNNHISNKINTVIAQVQHGITIKKVYDKCDTDITQITPNKIISILKNYPGILSTMNYIVNIIKLNISAERRKRFVDIQKNIGKFSSIIASRKKQVCNKIKVIDNPELKKNIQFSLMKTKVECSGMNPSYIQFVKQGQQQEFSQINTFKIRRTICQILKFQSLMR